MPPLTVAGPILDLLQRFCDGAHALALFFVADSVDAAGPLWRQGDGHAEAVGPKGWVVPLALRPMTTGTSTLSSMAQLRCHLVSPVCSDGSSVDGAPVGGRSFLSHCPLWARVRRLASSGARRPSPCLAGPSRAAPLGITRLRGPLGQSLCSAPCSAVLGVWTMSPLPARRKTSGWRMSFRSLLIRRPVGCRSGGRSPLPGG